MFILHTANYLQDLYEYHEILSILTLAGLSTALCSRRLTRRPSLKLVALFMIFFEAAFSIGNSRAGRGQAMGISPLWSYGLPALLCAAGLFVFLVRDRVLSKSKDLMAITQCGLLSIALVVNVRSIDSYVNDRPFDGFFPNREGYIYSLILFSIALGTLFWRSLKYITLRRDRGAKIRM